jgi:hypothetical protein
MSNLVFPAGVRGLGFSVLKSAEDSVQVSDPSPNMFTTRILQSQNPFWHWELAYDFLIDNPLKPTAQQTYTDLKTMLGFFLARGASYDDFLFSDPDDNSVGPGLITAGWQARYPYSFGTIIIGAGHAQQVTNAPAGALSGYSAPAFSTGGGSVADGDLTWHDLGAAVGGTAWPNPQAQLALVQDSDSLIWYSPLQRNMGGQFLEDITDLNPYVAVPGTQTISVYDNGVLKNQLTDYTVIGPGLAIPGKSYNGLVIQWAGTPTGPVTATFNFYFRVRFEMSRQAFEKWMNQWWGAGGDGTSNSDPLKLCTARTGLY